MTHSECKSCKAKILWARTEYGNLMPLDFQPDHHKGNIALIDGVAKVIKMGELFEEAYTGPRYVSHWSTCPKAHLHRRSAKKRED